MTNLQIKSFDFDPDEGEITDITPIQVTLLFQKVN